MSVTLRKTTPEERKAIDHYGFDLDPSKSEPHMEVMSNGRFVLYGIHCRTCGMEDLLTMDEIQAHHDFHLRNRA